jgi:hypothetical protein
MVLVGYWPLNESSKDPDAPTAKDHSGNENHGTINDGGDSTVPGAQGIIGQNAYTFDGSNDYVRVSNKSIFDTPRITVVLWFWVDSGSLDFSGPVRSMIARDDNHEERAWKIGVTDEGIYHAELNADTRNVIEPSKAVETGVWTQVALSYDGNYSKLFENGNLIDEASNSGGAASVNQPIGMGRLLS